MQVPDCPPEDYDVEELHVMAREHAGESRRYRERFLALATVTGTPFRCVNDQLDKYHVLSQAASIHEADCLRLMNAFFLAMGQPVGNEVPVKGHVYRVVTAGNPCVHLGQDIPDEAMDAIDAIFNTDWTDRDEVAERAAEYSEMTHYNAR